MKIKNKMKKISNNKIFIVYKLLGDILTLTFFAWAFFILAENILPGFISIHLSFLKLTLFTLTIAFLMSFLGKKLALTFTPQKTNKVLLFIVVIFFVSNLFLSLIKFNSPEIVVITIISGLICFISYRLFK